MNLEIIVKVANELSLNSENVKSAIELLLDGATIPFIARYRKEKTKNLDEEQLRKIQKRYDYLTKLEERKIEVLKLIDEKGKLTDQLKNDIIEAETLNVVEELYLPYKEKKKTRATIAIAKGLEPLANFMLLFNDKDAAIEAQKYLSKEVETIDDALKGAKDILAESFSDNHIYREFSRKSILFNGKIETSLKKDAKDDKKIYELYYDHQELLRFVPNHRILAINRGEKEGFLKVKIVTADEEIINFMKRKIIKKIGCISNKYVIEAIEDTYKRLLFPSIEREIRNLLTSRAEEKAIELFTINLEQLLLTPPFKNLNMLGVDPAFRTGCKLAVINGNGDFVYKDVIYPHEKYIGENVNEKRIKDAKEKVVNLIKKYDIELIAIGNGTASRETESFIAKTLKEYELKTKYIIVSEAGASVYSASELAKKEFPDLVVEERSAISIARRVIDPLSELIKIDPKSIGVGQYQHDVNQNLLEEGLDFTITKVVNAVGVNLNSASSPLLSYISGLNKKTADNIIDYRQKNGNFKNRRQLKEVKGIGEKSYEQAIGFLKILDSSNPLDKTFIHPEDYEKVNQLMEDYNLNYENMGSNEFLEKLVNLDKKKNIEKYNLGEYTYDDIINELSRPLRDIRDNYPAPILKSDILHLEDLKPGMMLQGTIRSIVDFGAFVDIGLKNDGLVHKSKMSLTKVNHPLEIVSVGQVVNVYVLEVLLDKQRVQLSLIKQN
ncbi:MAG: Tex family protein [Bacilli bacterium]|nr:Tex family protein [Bacilli bacterium]